MAKKQSIDEINAALEEINEVSWSDKAVNLSTVLTGYKMSEETKKKLSKIHKGASRASCSDTTKKNISDAKKGKALSENHKKKLSQQWGVNYPNRNDALRRPLKTPNGIFSMASEAALSHNIHTETIRDRIKSKPTEYYYITREEYEKAINR